MPGNIANRDKMAEMAKFRKAGKTRTGDIARNLGRRKGNFLAKGGGRIEKKPKNQKTDKIKSEKIKQGELPET